MRVAVVGHVEWIEFVRVPETPAAGAIVHASEAWEEPGGGGAVAAVQLARLADGATLYTALGDDELGHRAHDRLRELGLRVEVAWRGEPQRRAIVHLDGEGERTITVIGERSGPRADDPLAWDELEGADAVYFTAGDRGALEHARRAATLTATARTLPTLADAGIALDALVGSASDAGERYARGDLDPEPALVVRTDGERGGTWESADGESGRWDAVPLSGPAEDSYGCGDSFAAGLTWGLGAGMAPDEAVAVGARCGAACRTSRGPYAG